MQAHAHATTVRLEIQKLNRLPALSPVAQQFLSAVQDSRTEVRQLAAILEQDPGLMARLIGVANSAYYGYPEPVVTAEEAIFKVLGVNAAKSLALSIVLAGVFDARHCPGFRLDHYWEHAIGVAVLAQQLAPHVAVEPQPRQGEAYLAGLLHSIGILALVHLYPGAMAEVCAEESGPAALMARQRLLMGTDHCEVGGWLGRKWRLPEQIVAVIENHAQERRADAHWPIIALTRAACSQVHAMQEEPSPVPDLRLLGVAPEHAQRACEFLARKRAEIFALSQTLAHG